MGLLVRNSSIGRFGDVATQGMDSVFAGAQILPDDLMTNCTGLLCKGPAAGHTYALPLMWNSVNQLPVNSHSLTLKLSQEVLSFYPTEFRASTGEWASVLAKLTLQVLFPSG